MTRVFKGVGAILLSDHMKETVDIIAGYTTGRLVVESGQVSLLRNSGEEILLDESHSIEVRNDSTYQQITLRDALEVKTIEGWPLFAGLYTRIKL